MAAVQPRSIISQPANATHEFNLALDDVIMVPAPTRNIAKGERLAAVPFTTIKWPRSRISSEYLQSEDLHKEAVAALPLSKYLPVPLTSISQDLSDGNLVTERIPPGMRAITVRVDAEAAVEGWAQSGNFVDVIMVRQGKESGLESKVIAENIKILSAGRSAEPALNDQASPQPPSTVTLLVNQEDALKIKTASTLGKLTFALRGSGDQSPTTAIRLDQRTLLGAGKATTQIITGVARGPNGQMYTLGNSSRWVKTDSSRDDGVAVP